jgi:hypothetical protein
MVSISVASFQFLATSFQSFTFRAGPPLALEAGSGSLSQFEFHGDLHHHVHRRAKALGRGESPLAHRVDGTLIEPAPEAAEDFDLAHTAIGANDDFELDVTG